LTTPFIDGQGLEGTLIGLISTLRWRIRLAEIEY
jgi:hypothetical protein